MNSGLFEKTLCFSQVNFQPSATHKFVMDLALSHFIFDRPKIENILHDHQNIGAHTDIVQFQAGIVTTFRWTHPGARPLGFGVYNQCLNCKRLKTQTAKPNDDHSKILLKCRECKAEFVFNLERLEMGSYTTCKGGCERCLVGPNWGQGWNGYYDLVFISF